MAQTKKIFKCSSCGAAYPRWQGNCTTCDAWNSVEEQVLETDSGKFSGKRIGLTGAPKDFPKPTALKDIQFREELRFSTGFSEFDRVLGGGLVSGSMILIGGNPGAGKSTLLLQSMAKLASSKKVCYVSGEESLNQIALHSIRLGVSKENIMLLAESNLEKILAAVADTKPDVLVVDSIQTIYSSQQGSMMGGVAQVRECAMHLMEYAKRSGCAVFLVGHVTKEGALAGPRVLEHIVDCSLLLESTHDAKYRTLRSYKNRFGPINEIGVFAMTDHGMKPVTNPSAIFMSHHSEPVLGSATAIIHEGSRQLLVEIQALVDSYTTTSARRVSLGLDSNRVALLMGVLSCHCGLQLANNNVFINIVGGLRVEETGTDLPCILALVSIATKKSLPQGFAAFGEIGLTGEIRPSPYGHERVKAAIRQGMENILIPYANDPKGTIKDKSVLRAKNVSEALKIAFGESSSRPAKSNKKVPT